MRTLDLTCGFRLLRHAPGFALAGILIVALGVGTTTAIFSVVFGVMFRPLPYPEPGRLVALWSRTPATTGRVSPGKAAESLNVISSATVAIPDR